MKGLQEFIEHRRALFTTSISLYLLPCLLLSSNLENFALVHGMPFPHRSALHLRSAYRISHRPVPAFSRSTQSQQTNAKPSLQGVRIKARKGAVKAQAKHEPESSYPPLYLRSIVQKSNFALGRFSFSLSSYSLPRSNLQTPRNRPRRRL